ncbi:hypothetical protein IB234_04345 [Pseudomonas sp. PDM16]|uniref:hypothetical protein n=1 Tax=Pseudomonas sp. PDM16 TaxID=2769292 RepID=UPI001786893E|nr:hypothetical protein [Pseudomonas sp. PDM16]MBD9413787.1 hypothetical protein [Pseudomonas sp. PDM16]
MQKLTISLFLLIVAGQAQASSEQAWQAQERDMRERCLAASQLQQARIAGEPVLFDDQLGISALVISGRYPQPHMQGQRGRELCLYQRSSGTAHIAEADRLIKGR